MNHPRRIFVFVVLALGIGLLAPVALAQKPPAPPTGPPSSPPTSRSTPLPPSGPQPTPPEMDLVVFLLGRIATSDGTPIPSDVLVERIYNERVYQQVYASPGGDFSMQLGARPDSALDSSGELALRERENRKALDGGIPRRELSKCELRASASGFRSTRVSLLDLNPSSGSVDVGAIVVERTSKIKGMTLSAYPYKAPPNARKAYEKGFDAANKGNLAEARKFFEQAVKLYPKYASAWFQLGAVFEKQNQKDSARAAYTQAAEVDNKFLPPYLSLASLAFDARDWTAVLQYTRHVLDLDPFNYSEMTGYVLDLDELNPAQTYFYNAVANYRLNNVEEAEKSALKAERVDLRTNFPQLHILLAEIFARKKNYAVAISELQAYLELAPHAKDTDIIRERMAKLETLNRSAAAPDKPAQN